MMMMDSWFAMVGPIALIGGLIAVHAIYFRTHFPTDTRYVIGVPAARNVARGRAGGMDQLELFDGRGRDLADEARSGGRSSDVRSPGDPDAASALVARRIFGHDCGRIEVHTVHATELLDLVAQSLQSEALIVDGPARLRLAEISVSRLSSPALSLERHPAASDGYERKSPPAEVDCDIPELAPLIVMRSIVVEPGAVVTRPMIVHGDLDVGFQATIATSVKVHGDLRLAERVTVTAPVVANGDVICGTECLFMSDLVAKGTLVIRQGTRFGWVGRKLVTVIARRIRLSDRHEISGSMMSSLPFEVRYGG